MGSIDAKSLLKQKKVVEEIDRHKWLESEISGFDRGWDWAAEDWLQNYASAWVKYHMPRKSFKYSKKVPMTKNSSVKRTSSNQI